MPETRRVRELHVRSARADDARRAVLLIEDAFRTASIPGLRPGCLLVVRHLDLGRISTRRPSQAVAIAIAERMRQIAVTAVHGSVAGPEAAAVWFRDADEAVALLVAREVEGPRPREWFWSRVAPAGPVAVERRVAAVLQAPAGRAAAGVPAMVVAARRVEAMLAAVRSEAATRVVGRVAGEVLQRMAPPEPPQIVLRVLREAAADEVAPVSARAIALLAAGPAADRAVAFALAVGAVVARRPELVAAPALAIRARRVVERVGPARESPDPAAVAPATADPALPGSTPAPVRVQGEAAGVQPVEDPVAIAGTSAPAGKRPAARTSVPTAEIAPPVGPPEQPGITARVRWLEPADRLDPRRGRLRFPGYLDPSPTRLGGLFFLVPVLAALGLPAEVAERPELPWRIFDAVTRAREADPEDGCAQLVRAALGDVPPDAEAAIPWLERAGERLARLELDVATLVTRAGLVAATPTHIDVVLPLAAVDLRVRRGALDANPGWVPWLGRIVTFHYVDDDELPAVGA